jgi:quinol monooxygenase YgiN
LVRYQEEPVSEVVILARVTPKPGMESDVERDFSALLGPSHAEDGCELYALHRVAETPGELMFVERWASQAALDAHSASGHIAACGAACEGKLEGPVEIIYLDPIRGGDANKDHV